MKGGGSQVRLKFPCVEQDLSEIRTPGTEHESMSGEGHPARVLVHLETEVLVQIQIEAERRSWSSTAFRRLFDG
jgi:hypothetical protein